MFMGFFADLSDEVLLLLILLHLAIIGLAFFAYFLYRRLKMLKGRNSDRIFGENYNSLVEDFPGLAYRCLNDEFWTMKYVNRRAFELIGYTPEEIINNNNVSFESLILPKYRDKIRSDWFRVLADKGEFFGEYEIVDKSGNVKWVQEIGKGVYDKNDKLMFIEGFIYDRTKQKESLAIQRRSEARYRSLIETAQDPVYIDVEGVITYANPACVRFFRAETEQELIGKRVVDLIGQDYIHFYDERINRLRKTHLPNPRAEYIYKRFDGTEAFAEVSSTADHEADKMKVHVFIHDITEDRQRLEQLKRIQKRNRDLIVNMTEGLGVFSGDGDFNDKKLVYANRSFSRLLFGTVRRVIGIKIIDLLGEWLRPFVNEIESEVKAKERYVREYQIRNGEWLEVRFNVNDEQELIVILRDITGIKQVQASLIQERNRLETIIKATNSGTWEWFITTGELHVNHQWAEMLGYTYDELLPYTIDTWKHLVHPEDEKQIDQVIGNHLLGKTDFFSFEHRMKHKNGNYVWVIDRGSITEFDNAGKPAVMSGIKQNITYRKERELEISRLSYNDYLTGLYNRRKFEEMYETLDRQHAYPISFIFGDVDALKVANDAFGHEIGDQLLMTVAAGLKKSFSEIGEVFRIGGDEFAAILPSTEYRRAKIMAEGFVGRFAEITISGIPCSVSVGVATKAVEKTSIKEILKRAELEMYNNKLMNYGNYRANIIDSIKQKLFDDLPEEKIHVDRVKECMFSMGRKYGLSEADLSSLIQLAEVHDIGKIAIEKDILRKKTPLDAADWSRIRQHPETGYRILVASYAYDRIAIDVLSHHERWDGKGYPKQLKEDEIPWRARFLAVCEAYCAMTEDRPYHKAIDDHEAAKEILANAGSQFDPEIAEFFVNEVLGFRKN